ncbi:retinol dehydrogenase 7-like [Amblyomma americanum]
MRTSLVLCAIFVLLFWWFWEYMVPLHEIAHIIGSTWLVLTLSYKLSRLVWTQVFVTKVSGAGKAVLITGCDTGFGHRLARRLSRQGFLVFAGCLSCDSDGAAELKSLPNIKVLELDVTKQAHVDDALDTVKRHLGCRELWSVVANAGIGTSALLEWVTMDTVIKIFDVNVFGALRVTKKFLPLLKKSKGRVIAVASPLGRFTLPMIAPYCMSKHALVSMMDGLRRECYGSGVDFVIVEPSAYRTPIFKTGPTPMVLAMQEFKQQTPEVTANYSYQDIEDWMKTLDSNFKPVIREDPEECVDVIERAVRETYPKAMYRSPLGRDAPFIAFMTSFPSEVIDAVTAVTRKVQLRLK